MPGSFGTSPTQDGADVSTTSSGNSGIYAHNDATSAAPANTPGGNGVFGLTTVPNASGVFGANNSTSPGGNGVAGNADNGNGMLATTKSSSMSGVLAFNNATAATPTGTVGGFGVFGVTTVPNASGVFGANNSASPGGNGVAGNADNGNGMLATTKSSSMSGVAAFNNATTATPAGTVGGFGVFGMTSVPGATGVFGGNSSTAAGGIGVCGRADESTSGIGVLGAGANGIGVLGTGKTAVQANGNLQVNGDGQVTGTLTVGVDVVLSAQSGDCAEEFETAALADSEPGTVMVINDDGVLIPSAQAYDTRVAGVVSGAGCYRPGILLGRDQSSAMRRPVALVGKVYCRVDADYGPIKVGDLLTTSPTAGHAMRAQDPSLSFGAVIGKALQRLPEGRGLVPILVSLQ